MDYEAFNSRKAKIKELITLAEDALEEARELSEGLEDEGTTHEYLRFPAFDLDGPAYGMGGSLRNGEWFASSESC